MIEFAQEPIVRLWDEGKDLLLSNHEETGALADLNFEPDVDRYVLLEEAGVLRAYTARADGKLIGYAVFMITPHLHYPKLIWAIQDVVFVEKQYRGRPAVRFMRWMDEELRNGGANVVLRHVNKNLDYGRTLERLGYDRHETGFVRRF